jgi:thymidylate kinase
LAEQGKLIVLEGIDDVALSELAASLCRRLREGQAAVEQTREPTYGPAGAQVLLARRERLQLDPFSLALLCLADRLDHLHEGGVLAWLEQGRHVVCVHYALAAYARQWGQVDWGWQRQIDAPCRTPDLTLLVDLPCAQDPLRTAYRHAAARLQEEEQVVVVVDGGAGPDEALSLCRRHVCDLLKVPGTARPESRCSARHLGAV